MMDSEADISFQPPAPTKSSNNKSASETYQKLSQLEHILKRPDTYMAVSKSTQRSFGSLTRSSSRWRTARPPLSPFLQDLRRNPRQCCG